jgi:hypothetical protein
VAAAVVRQLWGSLMHAAHGSSCVQQLPVIVSAAGHTGTFARTCSALMAAS